jgi:O-antigen ligase
MILITFAVWFGRDFLPTLKIRFKNGFKPEEKYPFAIEIIALLIISFIAAGVTGFTPSALGIWKAYFFEPILLFILIFNIFRIKEDLTKIIWAFLVSAAAVSLLAIFQKITGLFIANPFWAAAETRRVVSFFGYPNAVGLYLAPLAMIFIGWLFSLQWKNILEQPFKKIIIILTIIASLLAIYSARSEGALLGLAAGLLIFGLLAGYKQLLITLTLLIILIGGVFWFAPTSTNNFILTKLTLRDLSGQIREQQWKETWKMLVPEKILTGAGLNNYQTAIKPYHQEGIFFNYDNLPNFDAVVWASSTLRTKYWQPVEIYLYPHNIILNFWSELGLIGALLFVWLTIKYLIISYKLIKTLGRSGNTDKYLILGLAAAMITIIVHGLVDVPYFKNDLAVMFWLLFALLGALNLNYRPIAKN